MSNLVNPSFAIPGYTNVRGTEVASPSGELRFLDHFVMASCILELDALTVPGEEYRLAGNISGLQGTIGNTPSITFVTSGGNFTCGVDGPFEFIYTAGSALDFIMPRSTSRTLGNVTNLVHEPA